MEELLKRIERLERLVNIQVKINQNLFDLFNASLNFEEEESLCEHQENLAN